MAYESELSKRLADISGLVLSCMHMGLEEKTHDNRKYYQDNWTVTIEYKGKSYTTKYFSGIGNRKLIREVQKERNRYYNRIYGEFKTEKEACQAQWLKLIPPTLADVMYCLLSDGRCCEGTFENFCDELGYDSDSRKALGVYLACQETRNAMINVLGQALFEELSQLEH